jgi:hypothetical protein
MRHRNDLLVGQTDQEFKALKKDTIPCVSRLAVHSGAP